MTKLPIVALLALSMTAAMASPRNSLAAATGIAEKTAPQGEDPPGPDSGANVSPPAENKGVIAPPPTGDTGIHAQVPNPNAGTPEEVIPPPGTPGGNPEVDPR
jgi:hypothetical protein